MLLKGVVNVSTENFSKTSIMTHASWINHVTAKTFHTPGEDLSRFGDI